MSRTNLRPIATVLATIIVMGLSIYGVLIAVARSGDARQRQIEEVIVRSALEQLEARLSSALHQNAYWNTAYDAMGSRIDSTFVRQQLVPDATWMKTSNTLIADAHSVIVYDLDRRGGKSDMAALNANTDLKALFARALRARVRPPVAMAAFVSVRDRLYLAAAQRIVPDDTRADGLLTKYFVLGYLAPLDETQLGSLQRGFQIGSITLARSPRPGFAGVALPGGSGKPIAYLNWRAAEPGRAFANEVAPFALAGFVLMGALQLLILKSWLAAAQRMRDEGIARTMFLANVSHELRTPLNAIIGFSECMSTETFGPLAAQYRDYANDILMSGKHLLGIVDDVLDLTQLTSTDAIALEPLTLSEAVDRPLRMLREFAKSDAIGIEFSDRSHGAQILANQKAISQLLLNLGSNAVKFSSCGATVQIALRRSVKANMVEIAVQDSGCGIPAEKLRLIGQPFLQAHNSTARKPGSGLGLAIVKTLAERLHGELVVQSAPGEGTTAIVRLPLHVAAESMRLVEATARAS